MKITRTSAFSGVVRSKDIPVNPADYQEWESGIGRIDDAMPYLTDEDREFILSGITPQEWKNAFSAEILSIVEDQL